MTALNVELKSGNDNKILENTSIKPLIILPLKSFLEMEDIGLRTIVEKWMK